MSNLFRTPEDYELFLYTLTEQFPSIRRSTVTLIRRGTSLARVAGELQYHKHIPPDIKHRRIPAPEMSFTQPNLPVLIRELESLIREIESRER